jgi:hypothetical protein
MLNHCFFCHQKLRISNVYVNVEPSSNTPTLWFISHSTSTAVPSAVAPAAVGAASAAVGAAIAANAAAATAAVSVTATIAVSAAAIAAALWLIVVCPRRCLCFHLPPPLPAPAIGAAVCRHHCHCHCPRRRNRCPRSFRHHRRHCCPFFCCWLRCLYVSTTATSVSVAAVPPLLFLMPSPP